MNVVYAMLLVGFGYWLGHPSKTVPTVINCSEVRSVDADHVVHDVITKPKEPVTVEPIQDKKLSPSPSASPNPSVGPESTPNSENPNNTDDFRVNRIVDDISDSLSWRRKLDDIENRSVLVNLDSDDFKLIEKIRQKITDGNMSIISEQSMNLGKYVYELKVIANP